ncbi:MAG: ParB/RepB/Spo0J family partition protein [Rhodospirillaceae bacterium]
MNTPKFRKSLGRGLNALFDDAGTNADVSDVAQPPNVRSERELASPAVQRVDGATHSAKGLAYVPISELFASPLQPRRVFDQRQIDELALSIKEKGVLQPLLVRRAGSGYEIVAGERRWRAAQLARAHQVPVLIRELNDTEVLEVALVENLQRADLTPLEEAQGYQRLIEGFGHTQGALASLIGKSRGHIANMIRLLALPDGVKALLDEGSLTVGHARALLGIKDAEALAKQIVKKGLSVRQVEALVRAHGKASRPRKSERNGPPTAKDADTLALESRLESALGLKAGITFDGKGGSLTLTYSDLEQLDDLVARLTMNNAGSKTKAASNREDKDPNVLDIEEVLAKREKRPGAARKENNSDT